MKSKQVNLYLFREPSGEHISINFLNEISSAFGLTKYIEIKKYFVL